MKKSIQKTTDALTYNAYFREACFLRLLPVLGGLFVLYIVFLGINLSNVLERSHTLSTINSFKRDHAAVESKYLALVEGLDREEAKLKFGLVEIQEVYFATETHFALEAKELPHNVR